MKLKGKIINGKIILDKPCEKFEGKEVEITVDKLVKRRTDQQRKAMHLWFSQLSLALNQEGYDMKAVVSDKFDLPWTPYTVKEYLWRPTQKMVIGERSTTKLNIKEVTDIYDIINKAVGERTGVHVPFPDKNLLLEQYEKDQQANDNKLLRRKETKEKT